MNGFDYKLAQYCAPTLAGIKPSSLIAVRREEWDEIKRGLTRSARVFAGRQIFFRRVSHFKNRVLLLVYRRDLLQKQLAMHENQMILTRYGYAPGMPLDGMLGVLAGRIWAQGAFPHEIGVFLGYPAVDVLGFIENEGKNYSICGCWKVYGDPVEARRLFSAYDYARCYFCERVQGGEEIQNIQYGGIS